MVSYKIGILAKVNAQIETCLQCQHEIELWKTVRQLKEVTLHQVWTFLQTAESNETLTARGI
jgi:hypothetical protein